MAERDGALCRVLAGQVDLFREGSGGGVGFTVLLGCLAFTPAGFVVGVMIRSPGSLVSRGICCFTAAVLQLLLYSVPGRDGSW